MISRPGVTNEGAIATETEQPTPTAGVLWLVPTSLLLLSAISIALLDVPIGAWFREHHLFKPLREFFEAAEHFGTPAGQFLLLAVIGWQLVDVHGRPKLQWDVRTVRIFVAALLSGLTANVFKLCITRSRPRAFAFHESSIWSGFGDWFPLGAGGSDFQSFPSAHTASAVGFAVLLSWAWPERRAVFFVLATLVGMQRIAVSAHFPSDVLAGAAVGWLFAQLYIRESHVSRWWTRWEERYRIWATAPRD